MSLLCNEGFEVYLKTSGALSVAQVDHGLTVSCYQAGEEGNACGLCDRCGLREQGFADAQLCDPTRYQ